jgi:antitoxin CptB
MLELDLIFENFLNQCVDQLTDAQADAYERLLNHSDPDLYSWLMGYDTPNDQETVDFVAFIRDI